MLWTTQLDDDDEIDTLSNAQWQLIKFVILSLILNKVKYLQRFCTTRTRNTD